MPRFGTVAVLLAALSLAGCGGSDVDVELVWGGPPGPGSGGGVSVDGAMAAAEFLRLDERTAATTTIAARAETGEGTGPQVVTVTLDGLADDSIRAERWTLGFEQDGDTYLLVAALRELRCQAGRGHQDFAPEPCA